MSQQEKSRQTQHYSHIKIPVPQQNKKINILRTKETSIRLKIAVFVALRSAKEFNERASSL